MDLNMMEFLRTKGGFWETTRAEMNCTSKQPLDFEMTT